MHPECQALFCFDQSSNHGAMAPDALVASKMNMNPGGKAPQMRDGWWLRHGEKILQSMNENGVPKGMKRVLTERGLWPARGVNMDCTGGCDGSKEGCCARQIMASQPDFQAQNGSITEAVLERGHLVEFYPKFHCECNFIERFWGRAKKIARAECDYSFSSLKERIPRILKEIPLATIRGYHRKAWRYIHAYSLGLTGRVAEWAVQKYKSHRKISARVEEIVELMAKEKESKE